MRRRTTTIIEQKQPKILIIGYGNPLRGDDGLGHHLIQYINTDEIRVTITCGHRLVQSRAYQQLTPELAEPISQAQGVIFVDARIGDVPGTLFSEPVRPRCQNAFSHHADPAGLLALALVLYGTCPNQALLLSVVGQSFEYNEQLSPVVEATLPDLLHHIQTWIEQIEQLDTVSE